MCWTKKLGLSEESSGEKQTYEQTKYEFSFLQIGKAICFQISAFILPFPLIVCMHVHVCICERERGGERMKGLERTFQNAYGLELCDLEIFPRYQLIFFLNPLEIMISSFQSSTSES